MQTCFGGNYNVKYSDETQWTLELLPVRKGGVMGFGFCRGPTLVAELSVQMVHGLRTWPASNSLSTGLMCLNGSSRRFSAVCCARVKPAPPTPAEKFPQLS